jgi:hypothetical protein
MLGKIVIGVFAIFLLLGAFASPISDGIKGWRTNNTTQSFTVTTGGGVTTANVTLAYDLYQASLPEIIALTSNNVSDTPVASSYTESTKVLDITGLAASTTRNLTVNYYAETDDTVMRALGPFLAVLIIGGCCALIFWGMMHKSGRRG